MSGISTRFVTDGDRERWEVMFNAFGSRFSGPHEPAVLERTWQEITSETGSITCLIASIGQNLVGFAHLSVRFSTFEAAHYLSVDDVYVDEDNRRNGVGTALMEGAFQLAVDNDLAYVSWWANKWNRAATDFHSAVGTFVGEHGEFQKDLR